MPWRLTVQSASMPVPGFYYYRRKRNAVRAARYYRKVGDLVHLKRVSRSESGPFGEDIRRSFGQRE